MDIPAPAHPGSALRTAAHWPAAVACGLQAAAWWLRRRATRCSVLSAVGVGLAFALAVYVAQAGSVLNWMTGILAWFGTS